MSASETKERFSAVGLIIEMSPLPIFLLAYLFAAGSEDEKLFLATGAYIAATVGATLAKLIRQRRIRLLSWISMCLIFALGGITLWLSDGTFMKIKPTLYALAVAGIAGFGLVTGRPWMQTQFDNDRHLSAIDEVGRRRFAYMILSMSLVAAVLNELVWRNSSTLFWIGFQIWGGILLFLLFAAAGTPIMSKHWHGQCRVRTAE